ncbi:MAG: hypothetical protein WCJ76_03460 [Comamonadaceae bacterium]
MKLRSKISTFALLCVALGSHALTLGPIEGAAILGQALDVVVQVQLEAGDDPALCFEAEVFHADARQDGGKVRTVIEKPAQGRSASVRVLSTALVDEPVVTINLNSTCGPKLSRRFVLFSDLPKAVLAGQAPLAITPVAASAAPGLAKLAVRPSAPTRLPRAKAKLSLAPEPLAVLPVDAKPHAAKRPPAAAAKALAANSRRTSGRIVGAARLKLDPLDVLSDRIANLDSFMSFAPSDDALANIQKVKTLETEVKALRDSALKNERALAEFRNRLQQAEAQRSSGELVYLLAGVVACCLLAVFWLWRRQQHGTAGAQNRWSDAVTGQAPLSEPLANVGAQLHQSDHQASGHGMAHGLEAQSVELTDSIFSKLMQVDASNQGTSKAAPLQQPHAKLMRSLNSDEILALRSQAEDWVVTGQPERALALLKKQVSDSDEPNPFVYLDLLTLFHRMNLQSDFQQCAQDFNLLFNGRVPEFAFFRDEGKNLESYAEVLSHITEHWPTLKVLEVIEACVFRDPWAGSGEPFDLAAMRDLMLLHGVAQSLVLAEIRHGEEATSAHSAVAEARPSQHAGLDFDYTDSVASSFPALSKSALADLFGRQVEPPPAMDLDLDLSALELTQPAPTAQTEPGLQLKNSGY